MKTMQLAVYRGYDVLSNRFFERTNSDIVFFDSFEQYYAAVSERIYTNACYYQYEFSAAEIEKYVLDLQKLNMLPSSESVLTDYFKDVQKEISESEKLAASRRAVIMNKIEKWKGFDYRRFSVSANGELLNSDGENIFDDCLIAYIGTQSENCFKHIIRYISDSKSSWRLALRALCYLYDSKEIYEAIVNCGLYSKKHLYEVKKIITDIESADAVISMGGFKRETGYYTITYRVNNYVVYKEFFDSYNGFYNAARKVRLSVCDLEDAPLLSCDKLNFDCSIVYMPKSLKTRNYNRRIGYAIQNHKFYVIERMVDDSGNDIYRRTYYFDFFFEYVGFLQGDLTDSDLICCDGLENLKDRSVLCVKGIRVRSAVKTKLDLAINGEPLPVLKFTEQLKTEENVEESFLPDLRRTEEDISFREKRVFYITDIHLMHRIARHKCRTTEDVIFVVRTVIEALFRDMEYYYDDGLLLIGGDVSSEYWVFELFVVELRARLNGSHFSRVRPIFVLGNHELWSDEFTEKSFSEIVEQYRELLVDNNMILLQNDLLLLKETAGFVTSYQFLPTAQIANMDDSCLQEVMRDARYIILGGMGFSGCNKEINADYGIYKTVIDRRQEIEESSKFESLYNRICCVLPKNDVIVFTHMPKKDWSYNKNYQAGYIYVSGHTHREVFYDDGAQRIYADNQVGYFREAIRD